MNIQDSRGRRILVFRKGLSGFSAPKGLDSISVVGEAERVTSGETRRNHLLVHQSFPVLLGGVQWNFWSKTLILGEFDWGAYLQTTLLAPGIFLTLAFPLGRFDGNFRIHETHGDLMPGKGAEETLDLTPK